jgi:hypothetical protein
VWPLAINAGPAVYATRPPPPPPHAPAKQAPTHATPQSPHGMNLRCSRAVFIERSRPSRRRRCPCPRIYHAARDTHDGRYNHTYPSKVTLGYNGYNRTLKPVSESSTHSRARGYIRRMRSRAPTETTKNNTNAKSVQLSLSTTP